jgi:hypothetical protein
VEIDKEDEIEIGSRVTRFSVHFISRDWSPRTTERKNPSTIQENECETKYFLQFFQEHLIS